MSYKKVLLILLPLALCLSLIIYGNVTNRKKQRVFKETKIALNEPFADFLISEVKVKKGAKDEFDYFYISAELLSKTPQSQSALQNHFYVLPDYQGYTQMIDFSEEPLESNDWQYSYKLEFELLKDKYLDKYLFEHVPVYLMYFIQDKKNVVDYRLDITEKIKEHY